MDWEQLGERAAALGCTVLRQEPLALHTSFQIGGPARLFVRTLDTAMLRGVLTMLREEGAPWFLMGRGSNLLAADSGFDGCVVQPSCREGEGLSLLPGGELAAAAGVSLAKLCLFARDNGLTGLEFAWGIPGSVGGAVYMNAGAYGGEVKGILNRVSFLDGTGEEHTLPVEELALSYRHSVFMERGGVITEAVFALQPGDKALSDDQLEELYARRREKQPLEFPSAGSTFKRPAGAYASALIEQCGLKGFSVGGAQVSQKHSGFVVNTGGATAAQVKELMQRVVQAVEEKTGYRLEPEVQGLPEGLLRELEY